MPRRPQLGFRLVVLAMALSLSGSAGAQRAIDAETFRPSLDGHGLLGVERAETGRQWDFGFKLTTDYAHQPLRLALHEAGMTPGGRQPVMLSQTTLHFGLYLSFTDWLELALEVPLAAQSYSALYGSPYDDKANGPTGFYAANARSNTPPPNAGVLDPRVALKARTRRFGPLGLALIVATTVPFGDDAAFLGDTGFTFRPTGVIDLAFGRFALALNVGAIVRRGTIVLDPLPDAAGKIAALAGTGQELTASLGAQVKVASWMAISAEAYALVPVTTVAAPGGPNVAQNVLGVLGALRFFPWDGRDFSLSLGAGAGLPTQPGGGPRQDAFRVLLGLAWTPGEGGRGGRGGSGDRDGDRIADGADLCPEFAEDKDGFEDADGCPDPDNDGDGVPDAADRCATEPEDRDGFQDGDGCPDADNDGDGVSDIAPVVPGGGEAPVSAPASSPASSPASAPASSPASSPTDRCPDEAEDPDGFEDDDGCPDLDNDGDGIPDARDRCPGEAETPNGVDDEDGCPDSGGSEGGPRPGAAVGTDPQVTEQVSFDKNKSKPTAPASAALDRAARLLLAGTRRARLELWVDPAERKASLGGERVRAVQGELLRRGVDPARIDVQAAAPRRKAGARRVDIVILEAGK